MIKFLIVGYGIQGKKRSKLLRRSQYLVVDNYEKNVDYKNIKDAPLHLYNAVMICVPDNEKIKIIEFCIKKNKHFLVEKPFPLLTKSRLMKLQEKIRKKKISWICCIQSSI